MRRRRRRRRWRPSRRFQRFLLIVVSLLLMLEALRVAAGPIGPITVQAAGTTVRTEALSTGASALRAVNGGWPQLSPLPVAEEVWDCEVAVIGGSLGGIAAASHAMGGGATTCLIELTPWLGGQVSSQGVSAIDESRAMRRERNFSPSWEGFKQLIRQQSVQLPVWTRLPASLPVRELNSCWVGELCFDPRAGAAAAEQWLEQALPRAPQSRWSTSTAFKGASFDPSGRQITAVYGVKRIPKDPDYMPKGRYSQELAAWYSWSEDEVFDKVPLRLQAPPGKQMIVIDATDTGEFIGWAGVPHRLGSDSKATSGEVNAPQQDNPDCTQAITYPFVMALLDDQGKSLAELNKIEPGFSREEHRREFDLERFPMFRGGSLFNYRRILSVEMGDPFLSSPAIGDMTLINWNRGNDWYWMDPPLIYTDQQIATLGERENWRGGMNPDALKEAENRALLFSEWLMETQQQPGFPLTHLAGAESPMGTRSGLSLYPYIREGRRILGRPAYDQGTFMAREQDLRTDMTGGRDFSPTTVGVAHYDIDIHGCRYRNWHESHEAAAASVKEFVVRPLQIPIEALIPQDIDNLLIGGKSMAVSHIVNAMTRVHYGEWSAGGAAGAIAAWLTQEDHPPLTVPEIVPEGYIEPVQRYLEAQGLRPKW